MGFLEAVKRKIKDVTGQTKAEETDKLVGEWSLVMREYADELKKLGDLYASVSGHVGDLTVKVDELSLRMTALAVVQKRATVSLWVGALSLGASLGVLAFVLWR